jgi:hypothetical protein
MTVSKREAEPYDEAKVMEQIISQGPNVIRAHLDHLVGHQQHSYLVQAQEILQSRGISLDGADSDHAPSGRAGTDVQQSPGCQGSASHNHSASSHTSGCPGSMARTIGMLADQNTGVQSGGHPADASQLPPAQPSQLRQWPVQLHLLNPAAQYFQRADVLLAADCTAFAVGSFHQDFLAGKTLAIACPKLDSNLETYVAKLKAMIDDSSINTLTVLIMEVPCCSGLLQIARAAVDQAGRKIPLKLYVLSLEGEILQEEWV